MPWFIPRNDNQSVFQPSVLNKLQTGRKRRDVDDAAAAAGISLDDTAIVLEEIQRALENIAVCEDLHLKKCPYSQIDHSHTSWLDQKRKILGSDTPGAMLCREDYETCLSNISKTLSK